MQLIKHDGVYVAKCSYEEREVAKLAGFKWDPMGRRWWTPQPEIAARLREFATPALAATLPDASAPVRAQPRLILRHDGLAWLYRCEREESAPAREAGFRWDPALKAWGTSDPAIALLLAHHATAEVRAELEVLAAKRNAARLASRATDAVLDLPRPAGLEYLGYQRAGIAYGMERRNVLIGDEMGLGKTIQAIGIANADTSVRSILVICPASLKLNWRRELQKWSTRPVTVSLATTQAWQAPEPGNGLAVTIAHYDIFSRRSPVADRIRATRFDMLVVDEAHLLKSAKSNRTRAILGAPEDRRNGTAAVQGIQAGRNVFLSGTPLVNRPIELWPLVSFLAPQVFPDWYRFATRYCHGHRDGWGFKADGASNLDELQDRLRESVMIRRLKREVLAELPAKLRQVIELPANGASEVIAAEAAAWEATEARLAVLRAAVELAKVAENQREYEAAVAALREGAQAAFTEMAKLRHTTALAKVPYVAEHVLSAAEEGGKIILFAHHKDVIAALVQALASLRPVQVHGGVSLEDRQRAVDTFQSDPACLLFVGQMQAAGVGLTLTASSHVVFAELDWVPGNLSQCEDRAHRIGQLNSVLVQHLVLEGSLDARMATVLVEKQRVLDGALDTDTTEARVARAARLEAAMAEAEAEVRARASGPDLEALIGEARARAQRDTLERESRQSVRAGDAASTQEARREELQAEGEAMTPAQVSAVSRWLSYMAGMDTDRAMQRNDVGFNRVDSYIGNALAARDSLTPRAAALGRKLLRKYHRQIGAEALAEMGAAPILSR